MQVEPPIRRPLRKDFPQVTQVSWEPNSMLNTILSALQKEGHSLDTIGRITIAYPHKDPKIFPNYDDPARRIAMSVQDVLQTEAPQVQWRRADDICEIRHLDRSSHHDDIVHTLTSRQVHATPVPENIDGKYFVMIDHAVQHGSTLADLGSYIESNGGRVLAVMTNLINSTTHEVLPLVASRESKKRLLNAFTIVSDKKRRPFLGCARDFNKALKHHGLSLKALTEKEVEKTISDFLKGNASLGWEVFPAFIGKIARGNTGFKI